MPYNFRLQARICRARADYFSRLASILDDAAIPPRKPGPLKLGIFTEFFKMPNVKFFRIPVELPSLETADDDVVRRELTVDIDGTVFIATGNHDALELSIEAKVNAKVKLSLVDIDDVGNRSEASEPYEFTVSDTVAPHKPGMLKLGQAEEFFKDVPDPISPPVDTPTDTVAGGTGQ